MPPPNGLDVVKSFTSRFDLDDRFRLPLTRSGDPSNHSALEEHIKSRLMEQIRALDLKEFIADFPKQS